jgi:hypothetical protein
MFYSAVMGDVLASDLWSNLNVDVLSTFYPQFSEDASYNYISFGYCLGRIITLSITISGDPATFGITAPTYSVNGGTLIYAENNADALAEPQRTAFISLAIYGLGDVSLSISKSWILPDMPYGESSRISITVN